MRFDVLALALVLLLGAFDRPARAGDAALDEARDRLGRGATDPFAQRAREGAIRELGRIGGREAAEALLEVFDDPFEHLRDRAVSAWAAMLRGPRAEASRDWIAGPALRHPNAAVRRGAADALRVAGTEAGRDAIGRRLGRERNEDVLGALLAAWPALGGGPAPAVERLLAHRSGAVALAAAEALVSARAASSVPAEARQRLLAHRDPLARAGGVLLQQSAGGLDAEALEAVLAGYAVEPKIALLETWVLDEGAAARAAGLATFARLLDDPSWRVRAAAVWRAVATWHEALVPLLIERLAREEGRLRLDLHRALAAMTGMHDLGLDPDLWRAWWAARGGALSLGSRPRGERPAPDPAAGAGGGTTTAAFFRLPVVSKRIAFLLDCSGSMGNPALGEAAGGPTKLEVAREELARTLAGLDAGTVFDVFLHRYPSDYPPKPAMTRALGRLEPCRPATARRALAWLARQEARGWGAFYDALALLIDREEVDTIFFLSDGRPSRGRYDRDFRVIDELTAANRFRQVAIHTVLVGRSGADRAFLERLARACRGRFVDAAADLEAGAAPRR